MHTLACVAGAVMETVLAPRSDLCFLSMDRGCWGRVVVVLLGQNRQEASYGSQGLPNFCPAAAVGLKAR